MKGMPRMATGSKKSTRNGGKRDKHKSSKQNKRRPKKAKHAKPDKEASNRRPTLNDEQQAPARPR